MFSVAYVDELRAYEIAKIASFFDHGQHVLEIGAGTGTQALELSRRGFTVTAIEVPDSTYAGNRVFPITDYDGRRIPLGDASVDVVFSSNVLEHLPDLPQMHREIRRVLKPGGYCVHVLPTHSWRLWTILTALPDAVVYPIAALPQLVPHAMPDRAELHRLGRSWQQTIHEVGGRIIQRRHGERGNVISELWFFNPRWWVRNFTENGFVVVHDEPMGLFYTGNKLLGHALSFPKRERLARLLGSACHLFKIVPASNRQAGRDG